MTLIPSLLFGISSSLDALLVGISLGLRRVQVRLWQNLLISLITLLGTCLSVGLGQQLAHHLPERTAAYVGSFVLILLGIYYILKWIFACLRTRRKDPENSELTKTSLREQPPSLRLVEVLTLSFTLSVNNMGMGLAASVAGLPLLSAAIATALFSILFLLTGNRLGRSHFLLFIGNMSDPLSGALLVGLGILQLF